MRVCYINKINARNTSKCIYFKRYLFRHAILSTVYFIARYAMLLLYTRIKIYETFEISAMSDKAKRTSNVTLCRDIKHISYKLSNPAFQRNLASCTAVI